MLAFGTLLSSGKAYRVDYPAALIRRDNILAVWSELVVRSLSILIDGYITTVYTLHNDISRPPPIIRYKREGVRPRASPLDLELAWQTLEQCKRSHVKNLRTIIACKNDEREYEGISESIGGEWNRVELLGYWDLNKPVMLNKKQIFTMADPSSHCGDETLVAIIYNWEENHGVYGPVKLLPPTNVMINTEEIAYAPGTMQRWTERGQTRRKSFRQLQGVFGVQRDITGNDLKTYAVPEGKVLSIPIHTSVTRSSRSKI